MLFSLIPPVFQFSWSKKFQWILLFQTSNPACNQQRLSCRHSHTFLAFAKRMLRWNPLLRTFSCHCFVVVHAHMWRLRIYIKVCYTAGRLRWLPKAAVLSTKSIYLCCMDRSAPTSFFIHLNASQKKAAAAVFVLQMWKKVKFPKLCLPKLMI